MREASGCRLRSGRDGILPCRPKRKTWKAANPSPSGLPNDNKGDPVNLEESRKKVAALTAPRNAVLVGASDRPGSWAAKVWENLNTYEFPGPIYLINPRRTEIWGQPCYRGLFGRCPRSPITW